MFSDISDFYDLYTKSLEEFGIKEKPDTMLTLYSYIKNAKMTYRVPISNKLIGFRLRLLNRYKLFYMSYIMSICIHHMMNSSISAKDFLS